MSENRAKEQTITASPASLISPEQYNRGFELFVAGETVGQICIATALDKNQVAWLARKGDTEAGMLAWVHKVAQIEAAERQQANSVTHNIQGQGAIMLANATEIAISAQSYIKAVMGAYMNIKVRGALQRLQDGVGGDEDFAAMAIPKEVRESLKLMGNLVGMETTARTYRHLYDQGPAGALAHSMKGLSQKVELGAEAVLPARVTTVETLPGGADGGVADPLDVMPEFKGWSMQEIQTFMDTGEQPAREYGEDEAPLALPPGAVDLDPNS